MITLHQRKLGPDHPRRSWPTRERSTQRTQAPLDQELSRLLRSASIRAHHFKLVIGVVVLLLVFYMLNRHIAGIVVAGLIISYLAWYKLTVKHWEQLHERQIRLDQRAERRDQPCYERAGLGRAADARQLGLAIGACDSLAALERRATECAAAIAHAAALVQLAGDAAHTSSSDRQFQLPIGDAEGTLVVFCDQEELAPAQRCALEHLALLVGIQAARLRCAARYDSQQAGLIALWEVAGILRSALDSQVALNEACSRVSAALDLDWLALVAPDERQAPATLLIARGGRSKPAPRLTGAQLRVAAEALRTQSTLIRAEGQQALTCLPIRLLGDAPLVLAAHGEALDAASQALLMLLGEMIVERLARPAADERRPVLDERPIVLEVGGMQRSLTLRESVLA
jgi:hypothetical protein